MDDTTLLQLQAEQLRASGVLGQSRLMRLFDFLVSSSAAGTAPKEAVIAMDVFEKTAAFDVSQDSTVRVYIHNLRRKLDQYYAEQGKHEPVRLSLPKGEYRLVVMPWALAPDARAPAAAAPTPPPPRKRAVGWGYIALALLLGILIATAYEALQKPRTGWEQLRAAPVWARLLADDKPTVIVIGDYYIFGDTEQSADVRRLIREFSINSKDDLDQYLQTNPGMAERYMDVGLKYLPISSAFALADVLPIVANNEHKRPRVMLMSSLDPATIKSSNVIYVGLLSGLGELQRVVFAASKFQVGDSYNELIDRGTQHHYISSATQYLGGPKGFGEDFGYHDYGYFSTFPGLDGNRIIIIAGTQDEGLRQTAEALADHDRLSELSQRAQGNANFEALVEVLSMDGLNMNGKLLVVSPLNPANIWAAR